MRKLSVLILAVIAAVGAFSATLVTDPPKTEAAVQPSGLDISTLVVPASLPLGGPWVAH
jgi:hypothetical protein